MLGKLTQPLFQVNAIRQGEGRGLGLTLVRAICERHQAKLALNNVTTDGQTGLQIKVDFPSKYR